MRELNDNPKMATVKQNGNAIASDNLKRTRELIRQ